MRSLIAAAGVTDPTSPLDRVKAEPATEPRRRTKAKDNASQRRGRIIRAAEACDLTGLSISTLARLAAAGEFPQRVPLSDRSYGYVRDEVEDWVEERIAKRGRDLSCFPPG